MSIDVGAHLKAVRLMYGLSQRELAKRAGVTNGLISLIEQNRVSPSVSSLTKVLDGVPMTLADFFTLDLAGKRPVFFPHAELPDLGANGVRQRLVGGSLALRTMSILHESYAPGADSGELVVAPPGERGGVIVRGVVELNVGGETRALGAGDAYYFRNSLPHRFRNVGREECEMVSASAPPPNP
jgi:transcriptional regulator with XRE-family HTH domain